MKLSDPTSAPPQPAAARLAMAGDQVPISQKGDNGPMGSSAVWSLGISTFLASTVEMVEALTIVLAVGSTREWRSTLWGVGAALVSLALFTSIAGYALATWLPQAALQLTVGTLMLIFGLQWLRKAILRSSGRKALHDEAAIFDRQEAAARVARSDQRLGLDWFAFTVSFKGVFLEGVEVVFIVITFGLNAEQMPVAITAAVAALVVVVGLAALIRKPLTKIPENTMKFGVGLLLATFGTFWSVEGLGVFAPGHRSIDWPGGDLVILGILAGWLLLSRILVRVLRVPETVGASA